MAKLLKILGPLVLLGLVPMIAGCLLDEKVIQIVVSEKTEADFIHASESEVFAATKVIDFAAELDEVIAEEEIERSGILAAFVTSLSYGVTKFSHSHDWLISGQILVGRDDIAVSPVVLVEYTQQSVQDALKQVIPVKLQDPGVAVINQALDQYIAGTHAPRLEFVIQNGDADPNPSLGDPIVFDWKSWLEIQVIFERTLEVPDPL